MHISRETIEQLYKHYAELDALQEQASDAIKAAQQYKEKDVVVTRSNGEKQHVTEKMLWDEVWTLGPDSEAGKHLRATYPEAFEKSDAVKTKVAELREFTLDQLGIDAQAIKLSDIVRITDALIDYKLNERQTKGKEDAGTS